MTRRISTDDLPRIAAVTRLAGELLDAHGPLLLELAASWSAGPRAASLEPAGGWRHEPCTDLACPEQGEHSHQVAPDTVGDAATNQPDPIAAVHDELHRRLNRIAADAAWIRDLTTTAVPRLRHGDVPDDGDLWCENHLAIQVCEPRFRGHLCRWCVDFKALHGRAPTPRLMGMRHQGSRITEAIVRDELKRQRDHDDTRDRTSKGIRTARGKRSA